MHDLSSATKASGIRRLARTAPFLPTHPRQYTGNNIEKTTKLPAHLADVLVQQRALGPHTGLEAGGTRCRLSEPGGDISSLERQPSRTNTWNCPLQESDGREGSSLVTGHFPAHPITEASPDPNRTLTQTLDLTQGRVCTRNRARSEESIKESMSIKAL